MKFRHIGSVKLVTGVSSAVWHVLHLVDTAAQHAVGYTAMVAVRGLTYLLHQLVPGRTSELKGDLLP